MIRLLRCSFIFSVFCLSASRQSPTHEGFRKLYVDAGEVVGKIRNFQGVNGPPAPLMTGFPALVPQYKDLRISFVRTHDFMGPADIDTTFDYKDRYLTDLVPNSEQRAAIVNAAPTNVLFPDSKADPERPESYNFGPTDKILAAIHESGAEVFYRIGRSWGANFAPPADFDRYANVVKHVAMHYNQGWANGFHYNIRYWEFWNEPDGLFWSGTPEQFYSLYEKTAHALKSVDPALKVGGDGIADPSKAGPFREGLFEYCAAHHVPLDFFSWHIYTNETGDPYESNRMAARIRELLDSHGFPKAESILSEWNLSSDFTEGEKAELQGPHNAAYVGSVLSYLQDAPVDAAMFYRGDAVWMGLFDIRGQYFKPAYTYKAMGRLVSDTPKRVAVKGASTFGFATLAGRSEDDKTVQVFISNYEIASRLLAKTQVAPPKSAQASTPPSEFAPRTGIVYRDNAGYDLTIDNLPWGNAPFTIERFRLDGSKNLDLVEKRTASGKTLTISNSFPPDSVELIVLKRK